jgi:hypothetical protein
MPSTRAASLHLRKSKQESNIHGHNKQASRQMGRRLPGPCPQAALGTYRTKKQADQALALHVTAIKDGNYTQSAWLCGRPRKRYTL